MTDNNHPITPPPELVQQWRKSSPADAAVNNAYEQHIATQAARWGADQELEACCADIQTVHGQHRADWLRSLRRPKPPSLKEQSLELIDLIQSGTMAWNIRDLDVVRRALEQLDD